MYCGSLQGYMCENYTISFMTCTLSNADMDVLRHATVDSVQI